MIHVVALPHTPFSEARAYSCAYTQKWVKIARGLDIVDANPLVYVAGNDEDHSAVGTVPICSTETRDALFGEWDPLGVPDCDWTDERAWRFVNTKMIAALDARARHGDVVLLSTGIPYQPIVDHFAGSGITVAEGGVGYTGTVPGVPHCWESYAWRHHIYGMYPTHRHDLDVVIGNPVDPDSFGLGDDEGYALFVGRCIAQKGIDLAVKWANESGMRLVIAGPGGSGGEGTLTTSDGAVIRGDFDYLGPVDPDTRRKLMAHASVLMAPTYYLGPWEGVHIEAMMSGVATVSTDLGVFTETIPRTWRVGPSAMHKAADAVAAAVAARGPALRQQATDLWGIHIAALRYVEWCDLLSRVRIGG